ncbi:hypothetical protein [Bradyrhizobium cytisi]|uniref:hypothetical protein n=1 Tax=Bradyrhizobium cytisi TaxID=515489 RepID=UPI0016531C60|nr:hypothetical protein [Bradyrhizobium cytisi]
MTLINDLPPILPFLFIGTELLIPSFKNDLQEDFNGKSIMEATRLADRQEGPAQGKSLIIQASYA